MIAVFTIALFAMSLLGAVLSAEWALVLVLLMFPLEQSLQASATYFLTHLSFVNIATGLVTVVSLSRIAFRQPDDFRNTLTFTLIASLTIFVWSGTSLVWSPSQKLGPQFVSGGVPYVILLVGLAPIFARDMERMGRVLRLMLYLGTAVVTLMIFNPNLTYYSGRLGLQIEGNVRTNPLAIGELGGSLIILATLLREGPTQWLINVCRIAAFASGGLLALESGSRGQLLFSIGLGLFLIPLSRRVKNVFQFIGTLTLIMLAVPAVLWLAKTFLGADVLDRWSGRDVEGGLAVRLANWGDLMLAWVRAPHFWLQGLGFNAFSMVTTAGAKEEYPHNIFVEILAEEGLLMFTLFVIILIRCFRDGLWLFRRFLESPAERASISTLIAITVYYFLIANKQANLWGQGMLFMLLCILTRLRKRTEAEDLLHGTDAEMPEESAMEPHDSETLGHPVTGGASR